MAYSTLLNPSWVSKFYTEHKMVLCFMGFILNASNVFQPVKFHRLNYLTEYTREIHKWVPVIVGESSFFLQFYNASSILFATPIAFLNTDYTKEDYSKVFYIHSYVRFPLFLFLPHQFSRYQFPDSQNFRQCSSSSQNNLFSFVLFSNSSGFHLLHSKTILFLPLLIHLSSLFSLIFKFHLHIYI
jgi:hypothetical protein